MTTKREAKATNKTPCVCIHVCMYVCIYICIYIYICIIYIYIYISFGTLADFAVDAPGIDKRIAEIHRALVAHDALCAYLVTVGVPMPIDKLRVAIDKAWDLGLISWQEVKWLRYFNFKANEAKHRGLPCWD